MSRPTRWTTGRNFRRWIRNTSAARYSPPATVAAVAAARVAVARSTAASRKSKEHFMSPLDGLVAYIGLGSNLGDPARQVRDALGEIAHLPESGLVARSPLYRSAPMGPQEQPHYVNAVAALRTRLTPRALMEALRSSTRPRVRSAPPASTTGC